MNLSLSAVGDAERSTQRGTQIYLGNLRRVMESDDSAPRHVEGRCDLGDCDSLATRAYVDSDGEIYIEVCPSHGESLESEFDSDYDEVERDSPYRDEPERHESHACGGQVEIHETPDGYEYRVCDSCDYALLIDDSGEGDGNGEGGGMEVEYVDRRT
ncbi:hypothetical protein ACEU6E_06355 [Halorutilales archaeon Cl-col2-1]